MAKLDIGFLGKVTCSQIKDPSFLNFKFSGDKGAKLEVRIILNLGLDADKIGKSRGAPMPQPLK